MAHWFESSFNAKKTKERSRDANDGNSEASKASTSSGPGETRSKIQGSYPKRRYPAPQNWEQQPIRPLASLTRRDQNVNVFAVVTYYDGPKATKGPDMFLHFSITDSSLCDCAPLKCLCFLRHAEDMPVIERIGDIVKLPLRISMYAGDLQGRTHDGPFPWMSFDGRDDAPIQPRFSRSFKPNFTDIDRRTVEELKAWALSKGITACPM